MGMKRWRVKCRRVTCWRVRCGKHRVTDRGEERVQRVQRVERGAREFPLCMCAHALNLEPSELNPKAYSEDSMLALASRVRVNARA